MGNAISSLIADLITGPLDREDCKNFLEDFPNNIWDVNLLSVLLGAVGWTCKPNSNIMINLVGNIGLMLGAAGITYTSAFDTINKLVPKIFLDDPRSNSAIFLYLIVNIVFLLIKEGSKDTSFAACKDVKNKPICIINKCISAPISCVEQGFKALASIRTRGVTSLGCIPGYEKKASLCYPLPKEGYSCLGPTCAGSCDPKNFINDGLYCRKKTINRGVGKPPVYEPVPKGRQAWGAYTYPSCPEGANRTASLTCDFGKYGGVYTNCTCDIAKLKQGDACTNINWNKVGTSHQIYKDKGVGWHKTATCSCQKGGVVTSANYGPGVTRKFTNPPGYTEKHAGLWYKPCPSGYDGDATLCYAKCQPGFKDIGVSCAKPTYSRGVGKSLLSSYGACPEGLEQVGKLCYKTCGEQELPLGISCYKVAGDGDSFNLSAQAMITRLQADIAKDASKKTHLTARINQIKSMMK